MPDEWPWGLPDYVSWQDAYNAITALGGNSSQAATLAAIGTAESSLDLTVLNNTPATGDYSIGIWQVNYYGDLLAGRTAAYGSPEALATGGLAKQAVAAWGISNRGTSFTPWSTYKSGAYAAYLHGYSGAASPGVSNVGTGAILFTTAIPTDVSSDSPRPIMQQVGAQFAAANVYGTGAAATIDAAHAGQ